MGNETRSTQCKPPPCGAYAAGGRPLCGLRVVVTRPVSSLSPLHRPATPRLAVPGDGVNAFPRSLAHTIEPRAPIGKLGFTEGDPLLEIGEHMQERVSMHAAQYTTTPISWALIAALRGEEGHTPRDVAQTLQKCQFDEG